MGSAAVRARLTSVLLLMVTTRICCTMAKLFPKQARDCMSELPSSGQGPHSCHVDAGLGLVRPKNNDDPLSRRSVSTQCPESPHPVLPLAWYLTALNPLSPVISL